MVTKLGLIKNTHRKCLVGLAGNQAAEQVEGGGGLIVRNHVTSVEDADVGEVAGVTDRSPRLTTRGGDGVVVGVDKLVLTRPLHRVQQGRGTIVVANQIVLTVVEDDGDGGEQVRDQSEVAALKVVLEVLVDTRAARLPGAVSNTKLGADVVLVQPLGDGVKVVAERAIALLTNIINVDVAGGLEADLHDHVAVKEGTIVISAVDIISAGLVLLVGRVEGRLVDLLVVVQEGSIRVRLNDGVDPAVSNSHT